MTSVSQTRTLQRFNTVVCLCGLALTVSNATACKGHGPEAGSARSVAGAVGTSESMLDWALLFYMPYDNNLDVAYRQILEQLDGSITSKTVAVAIQVDRRGAGGSIRHAIDWTGLRSDTIEAEDSSDPATFGAFLQWAGDWFPAHRYAVIVLGHGGTMEQVAFDEYPRSGWMELPELADTLEGWRVTVGGDVELLFLQQCGKGSIENFYELRDTARVLMSSQTSIGAPNAYYADLVHHVSARPASTGVEVAQRIAESDADGMFVSYSAVWASALSELPEILDSALRPLAGLDVVRVPAVASTTARAEIDPGGRAEVDFLVREEGAHVLVVDHGGAVDVSVEGPDGAPLELVWSSEHRTDELLVQLPEGNVTVMLHTGADQPGGSVGLSLFATRGLNHCFATSGSVAFDLVQWLEAAFVTNDLALAPVSHLRDWISTELVGDHHLSACCRLRAGSWSGVSTLVPIDETLDRYADYAIYQDTMLREVYDKLAVAPSGSASPEQ